MMFFSLLPKWKVLADRHVLAQLIRLMTAAESRAGTLPNVKFAG